jgi:hypothetical protein
MFFNYLICRDQNVEAMRSPNSAAVLYLQSFKALAAHVRSVGFAPVRILSTKLARTFRMLAR